MIDVITVCLSRAFPAILIANHVGVIPGDKVADVHNLIVTISVQFSFLTYLFSNNTIQVAFLFF